MAETSSKDTSKDRLTKLSALSLLSLSHCLCQDEDAAHISLSCRRRRRCN